MDHDNCGWSCMTISNQFFIPVCKGTCAYTYLKNKTFILLKIIKKKFCVKVPFNSYNIIIIEDHLNSKITQNCRSQMKKIRFKLFFRKYITILRNTGKKVLLKKKNTHYDVYIYFLCDFQQTPVTLFPWIVRQWKRTRGVTRQRNLQPQPPPRRSQAPPRKTPRLTMALFRNQNSLVITLWLLQ